MTFDVSIKERYRLNESSDKETYHLSLDLSGTEIQYEVGDCIAIYPQNDPILVQKILDHFASTGEEIVTDRKGVSRPFKTFLTSYANLLRSPKMLGADPQEFAALLPPLLPRFYSIASSMKKVGKEAHLVVKINENPAGSLTKYGTCSHYLCKRAPLGEPSIRIYHQKSKHFYLSLDSFAKPIIMIGPGTGVAPFRGFLQERMMQGSRKNWLFFGERHQAHDYYYEAEWKEAIADGFLQIETAFSRDREQKVYVQDRMMEKSALFWQWLEGGAYLYVCGDAKEMAKSVEEALHVIIEQNAKVDPKEYIRKLKREKRYLRDVY